MSWTLINGKISLLFLFESNKIESKMQFLAILFVVARSLSPGSLDKMSQLLMTRVNISKAIGSYSIKGQIDEKMKQNKNESKNHI